jgi:hypothetical protein
MSSGNPYASASSSRGYPQKKKRNLWLWIGIPVALLIILGAVLGGVLGTQLNKGGKKTSSSSSNGGSGGAVANTGVPSGVTSVNSAAATETGANGQAYLAVATNSYMLPVYATGVSKAITFDCPMLTVLDQYRRLLHSNKAYQPITFRCMARRSFTSLEWIDPKSSSYHCPSVQVGRPDIRPDRQ